MTVTVRKVENGYLIENYTNGMDTMRIATNYGQVNKYLREVFGEQIEKRAVEEVTAV